MSIKQESRFFKRIGKLMLVTAVLFSTLATQLAVGVPKAEAASNGENAPAKFYIPTYHISQSVDSFKFTAFDTINGTLLSTTEQYEARTQQNSTTVHHNYSYHAVDPDGRFIAMASYASYGGVTDLHFIDTQTGTSKTLKTSDFWPIDATFSTDGTQAIFMGRDNRDVAVGNLKIVSVDMSKLSSADANREATWKKDIYVNEDITYPNRIIAAGDYFYVASGDFGSPGKVTVYNANTHTFEKNVELNNNSGYEVGKVTQMFVSPDSRYVYAFSNEVMPGGQSQTMARIDTTNNVLANIYSMSYNNTIATGIPNMLTLSPDGRLFYMSYGRDVIDAFYTSDGNFSHRIQLDDLEYPNSQYDFKAFQIGLSPDGNHLIVHLQLISDSKIRVLELTDDGRYTGNYEDSSLNSSFGTFYNHKPEALNFPVHYLDFTLEVTPDPIIVTENSGAQGNTYKQQLVVKKKLGTLVDKDVTTAPGVNYVSDINANPFIAGVNSFGEVQGARYGTMQFTIQVPGMQDHLYDVKVIPNLSALSSNAPTEIFAGDEVSLTVTGTRLPGHLNSDVTLQPEDVTFTSLTPSLIEIDSDGKMTAKADATVTETVYGRAQVQIDAFGQQQIVDIDVKLAPLSGFELTTNEVFIDEGDTHPTVVNAVYGNWKMPYIGALTFNSDDPSVATVDPDGTIRGLSKGEANITVTPSGYPTMTFKVNVTSPLTGLTFEQATYTIRASETQVLRVKATYADGSERFLRPGEGTYSTSTGPYYIDLYQPVDAEPYVVGNYESIGINISVNVSYNGHYATTAIVIEKKLYGLSFSPYRLSLDVEEEKLLSVQKMFAGTWPSSQNVSSADGVTYRIDDPSIVSITGDTIKGLRDGVTKIHADYVVDSITYTATSEVTVGGGTPGGNTPGGNTPGGNTPGGNAPGGNTPGDSTPENSTPGDSNSGENNAEQGDTNKDPVQFTDTMNHWARTSIDRGIELGIVNGFADGTFLPNNTISRGQFAVMLQRALGLETSVNNNFTDRQHIPSWAQAAIDAVVSKGYIIGHPDGSFRSEEPITRAQLAVIIARILNVTSDESVTFTDASSIPAWAAKEIAALAELDIMVGRGNGQFNPHEIVTRAEALVALLRMLDYIQKI